jgi:hypothetical protein
MFALYHRPHFVDPIRLIVAGVNEDGTLNLANGDGQIVVSNCVEVKSIPQIGQCVREETLESKPVTETKTRKSKSK